MKTESAKYPIKALHKNLGECLLTEACAHMEKSNPDSSSIFVEHDGDVKEVTRALVTIGELEDKS